MQGAAEKHYPTMGIDELCALPVPELAAKDCALFLWATFPQPVSYTHLEQLFQKASFLL